MKRTLSRIVALASALSITAVAVTASAAATGWVTPNIVGYSGNALFIQAPSGGGAFTNYEAMVTPPSGCTARDLDTLKAWQSLAQSAFLSGKTLKITYTACGGINNISNIWLG